MSEPAAARLRAEGLTKSFVGRRVVDDPKNWRVCSGWDGSQRSSSARRWTKAFAAATSRLPTGLIATQTRLLSGANGTMAVASGAMFAANFAAAAAKASAARIVWRGSAPKCAWSSGSTRWVT